MVQHFTLAPYTTRIDENIYTSVIFFPINTSNKDDYISMESINNNKKSTTNQNPKEARFH